MAGIASGVNTILLLATRDVPYDVMNWPFTASFDRLLTENAEC